MSLVLKPLHAAWLTATVLVAVAGIWLLRNVDPNMTGSLFPSCMFRDFTGYLCIGCGMTRMLHALVHADLLRAFAMNPLAMSLLLLSPLLGAWKLGWRPRWLRPLVRGLSEPKFWLVLLPAYWVARNLPWFPFTLLAPG